MRNEALRKGIDVGNMFLIKQIRELNWEASEYNRLYSKNNEENLEVPKNTNNSLICL
jgi:hypothetical protein